MTARGRSSTLMPREPLHFASSDQVGCGYGDVGHHGDIGYCGGDDDDDNGVVVVESSEAARTQGYPSCPTPPQLLR